MFDGQDKAPIRIQKIRELFASKGVKVTIEDFGDYQVMKFTDLGITLIAHGNRYEGGWFGCEQVNV